MKSLRHPRRWAPLLLFLVAVGGAIAITGNWAPLLLALPWLAAVGLVGWRNGVGEADAPSLAEAARRRLWV